MTREVGMLFQGEMVRALRAGLKTNTRRGLKPPRRYRWSDIDAGTMEREGSSTHPLLHVTDLMASNRYARVGDVIWVRETHAQNTDYPPGVRWTYRADPGCEHDAKRWTPAIHMPREACRLLLTVTRVELERVQDISEADAIAEGIQRYKGPLRWVKFLDAITGEPIHNTARAAYLALYAAINGQEAVDRNDWVRSTHFTCREVF